MAPLVVFVFWIGLKPQTFLEPMQHDIGLVTAKVEFAFAGHQWPTTDADAAAHADLAPPTNNLAAATAAPSQPNAAPVPSAPAQTSAPTDKVEDLARVE